jgi:hypothetical protein
LEAGAGAPCAAHHTFCEDFSGPSVQGNFTHQDMSNGSLGLDSMFVSPPSALLARTQQLNVFETRARLSNDFTTAGRVFRLAWSEWIDGTCIFGTTGVATAAIELPDASLLVAVEHGALGDWIHELGKGSISTHSLTRRIPQGVWTRLELSVDATASTATVSIDGVPSAPAELANHATPPQAPRVYVGAQLDNIQLVLNACQVRIDDVAFDIDIDP